MSKFILGVEDSRVLEKITAVGFPEKEVLSFLSDWAADFSTSTQNQKNQTFIQQFMDNLDAILPILKQKLEIPQQSSLEEPLKEDPTADLSELLTMFGED